MGGGDGMVAFSKWAFGIADWCPKNESKDKLSSQQIIIIAIFMGQSCSAFELNHKFQSLISIPSLEMTLIWLYINSIAI